MTYLAIGVAGIIGALLRYFLGLSINSWWTFHFPFATLLSNYIGCLVLGWFTTWVSSKSFPEWLRMSLGTGLIGSFTTFSTFSVETIQLIEQNSWLLAFLYVALSLFGGLLMADAGYKLAKIRLTAKKEVEEGDT